MSLGILLLILGALPIIAGVVVLFRMDPAAFIFAIVMCAVFAGSLWLIGHGAELVTQ